MKVLREKITTISAWLWIYSRNCFGYWYEILNQRNLKIIRLQYQSNSEDNMDGKVAKNSRIFQENQQRAVQNISHLHDESNVFYKRARPDIEQSISLLSSRVKDANYWDWNNVLRVMSLLKRAIDGMFMLEANDTNTLTWCIDLKNWKYTPIWKVIQEQYS